jgi:hypothetical protein
MHHVSPSEVRAIAISAAILTSMTGAAIAVAVAIWTDQPTGRGVPRRPGLAKRKRDDRARGSFRRV